MAKRNGESQLPLPLPKEEIKRLQEDLVGKILVVKSLTDEKTAKMKGYNDQIKAKQTDITAIAETLREQGGIDVDIEKMLKGIHQQMEADEAGGDQPEA